jgi:hypothetical protein
MSSVEVYVVVEGRTEQTFIRDVLAPAASSQGIYLYPALIGKPGHKGGDVRFDRAKDDIGHFLQQRTDTYVSTMFDYSGIGGDWPGRAEIHRRIRSGRNLTAAQKADILEAAMQQAIEESYPQSNAMQRFIPYMAMHEFEALLFSDAHILAEKADIDVSAVDRILGKHGEPEEINDKPLQAPCKQIMALNDNYRKVAMGKAIAEAIGIPTLREKCSHFNEWLLRLERLAIERGTEQRKVSSG